jgi:hypothetical protein
MIQKIDHTPLPHTEQIACKLITCTGYGGTGSSAGTNILWEFESVKDIDNDEFTFLHEADGIADLENSLAEGHRLKTDLAIKRFIKLSHNLSLLRQYKIRFNGKFKQYAIEFIDSIVKCRWKGWWHRAFEVEPVSKIDDFNIKLAQGTYDLLTKSSQYNLYEPDLWYPQYKPQITEYYSNFQNEQEQTFFIKQVKHFTARLLQEENINEKYKYIMLDQAIPPVSISKYLRYWDDPRVIVIDRDPRDLYVINKAFWGYGFIPMNSVDEFIKWYSATRCLRENEPVNSECCLFLNFESLVYDYDNTLNRIMNFIDLPAADHVYKLKYFNPDLSKQNTMIFKCRPDFYDDVSKIEKELSPYCYPYPDNYIPQNISNSNISVQKVYEIIADIPYTGRIPKKLKRHSIGILFRMTNFYQYFKERRNRNGLRFLKFLIKISIFALILPLDFTGNLFFFFISKNKLYRFLFVNPRILNWY